jgi:hypothetical protein
MKPIFKAKPSTLHELWKKRRGPFLAKDKSRRLVFVQSLSQCEQLAIVVTKSGVWDVEPAFSTERGWRLVS